MTDIIELIPDTSWLVDGVEVTRFSRLPDTRGDLNCVGCTGLTKSGLRKAAVVAPCSHRRALLFSDVGTNEARQSWLDRQQAMADDYVFNTRWNTPNTPELIARRMNDIIGNLHNEVYHTLRRWPLIDPALELHKHLRFPWRSAYEWRWTGSHRHPQGDANHVHDDTTGAVILRGADAEVKEC